MKRYVYHQFSKGWMGDGSKVCNGEEGDFGNMRYSLPLVQFFSNYNFSEFLYLKTVLQSLYMGFVW